MKSTVIEGERDVNVAIMFARKGTDWTPERKIP
jgi:hypothetical protein